MTHPIAGNVVHTLKLLTTVLVSLQGQHCSRRQSLVCLHAILWDYTRCQEALCLSAVIIHPARGVILLREGAGSVALQEVILA